jgi:hypothetical protein
MVENPIGFWWLFGVTLQTAAGLMARSRAVDPEIAYLTRPVQARRWREG